MRKLNIIICLSFAFIFGGAGSSTALPQCSAESDYWNNCFGTRTYDNEYKYVGEFKDDKKHGQGTYTWATGNKYVGEFKDNKINGKGTFTSADGEKYVGEFKNNQIHGHGTRSYSDGRIDEGENVLETEDFAAIQLASIIFLPITASSVLNSFDYDNDGLLSKNEVFGDTEFSKLVGINIDIFSSGFEFKSLGKKLQDAMEVIPLLK